MESLLLVLLFNVNGKILFLWYENTTITGTKFQVPGHLLM